MRYSNLKSVTVTALLAAVVFPLMLVSSSCSSEGSSSAKVATIGAVLSLTGEYEIYGQEIKRGIDLAVKVINNRGTIKDSPYKVVYKDSGSTAEGAIKAIRELEQEGIRIIIGPETSDLAERAIPVADQLEVVLMSPSASAPALNQADSRYFFRICTTDDDEAQVIAQDIARQRVQKWLKSSYSDAFVLYKDDDLYSSGLLRAFSAAADSYGFSYSPLAYTEEELPENPGEIEDNPKAQEILTRISEYQYFNSDEPDKMGAIVIFGFSKDVKKLLELINANSAVESKYKHLFPHRIYTTSSVDTATFFQSATENYAGLIFPRVFDPIDADSGEVSRFVDAYQTEYQGEDKAEVFPGLFAAYGYDAALLIGRTLMETENLDQALKDPRNLRLSMNAIKFSGATGAVNFGSDSYEVNKLPNLYIISTEVGTIPVEEYEDYVNDKRNKELEQSN